MFKLKMIKKPILFKLKCDFTFPPIVLANMQEKEAIPTKEQQEIVPDKNYDGLSKVTVNAIPDEYIIPNGELEIIQNGIYDVSSKASAKVNVPEKVLGTKTITKNGTYNATDDNLDGYSKVEVATSGVDINDYFTDTIKNGNSNEGGWVYCIKKLKSPLTVSGTSGYYMFGMYRASEIPVIDTSNITYMSCMFIAATGLTSLDLNYWNTSKVYDMSSMFKTCTNLTDLKIGNWDTSNVENMSSMFQYSGKLTNLDLSKWNTNKVKNMNSIFASCNKLTNLDIRNFDFSNVTSYTNMFKNVPTDCLIIVKDDTAKTWITSKFTTLTNVKTVAELEQ